ncbi:uncharacterized protein [Nicotiana sylvestris]|uniref:uncharacterized protein n=1 Tax=Nicotiana sylvestris TaxID=4096 RepID=UPI00388CCE51
MSSKETDIGVVHPLREIVESESELKEEVRRLKQQMAEMYQSWIREHPPPSLPINYIENPATIPPLSQSQVLTAADISPQPFHTPPLKSTSYPAPLTTRIFVAHPPATLHRSSSETVIKVPDVQHYALELIFKVSGPYSYAPHFEPLGETAKPTKIVEQDEISIKLKGSKIPKLNLYGGRGDPVAHLRGYCSEMRSVCGKDKVLMAYFSQSLSRAALEWYTYQDAGKWHAWGDLSHDFVRHYQYNVDIIPDRSSLSQIEKKLKEGFREFWFRWNEQVAGISPLIDREDVVEPSQ